MDRERDPRFFGLVAVMLGIYGLLQYFGLLGTLTGPLWALTFLAAGALFVGWFFRNREHWWALIPGVILATTGVVVGLDELGLTTWGGPIMLAGVGLAFLAVLAARPDFWWALIPAGVMFSLTTLVLVEEHTEYTHPEAMLFFGLAATFALLGFVRRGGRRQVAWLVAAGALGLLGLAMAFGRPELINLIWPIALIAGGIYLALRGRGSGGPPVVHTP